MSCYEEFVKSKLTLSQPCGFEPGPLPERLFPHQAALVRWAIRRGRAAVFAATGLGKTSVYLAWADAVQRHTGGNVLVLAPLAVVAQGCEEASALGLEMHACRSQADVRPGINATNYDRLHLFDPSQFAAVVLDESSCIKHHDAKTLQTLLDAFAHTPYKLCCTATPAPNDWTELGTHAEFLNVCSRAEMLAEYFVHDGGETQTWRLKGHARTAFWRWVSSWGALVRSPADLGFDGSAYVLPELVVHQHVIAADQQSVRDSGLLFAEPAKTLMERRAARRGTIGARVEACVFRIKGQVAGSQNTTNAGELKQQKTQNTKQNETTSQSPTKKSEKNPTSSGAPITKSGLLNTGKQPQTSATLDAESDTQQTQSSEKPKSETQEHSALGTLRKNEKEGSAQHSESQARITIDFSQSRAVGAQFAAEQQTQTRTENCTLTTATKPAQSAASSARLATWDSESSTTIQQSSEELASILRDKREQWVVWCELNSEQDALTRALGSDCVSIYGSMSSQEKEELHNLWLGGYRRVLVSKVSIFGFGLNWQHCARMAFIGVTDSWESYHQAIRRCWRFGQKRDVHVHVYSSELEGAVVRNLARKEKDAERMAQELSAETGESVRASVLGSRRETNSYEPLLPLRLPDWLYTKGEV